MKRGPKKPVEVRRFWPINPKTRVKEGRRYNRKAKKKAIDQIYENQDGQH